MSESLYDYPPMPPEPDGQPAAETVRGITRQEFLRLGAISLIGSYVGNKAFATWLDIKESKLWPHNEPTFNLLNNEAHRRQTELGIFLPGFGDMHSEEEATLWTATSGLPKTMLTGYLDYSNQGTDIKTMVQLIRQQVDTRRIKSLTMFGRSIGGLFALPIAAELGVPVKSLVLCSSPSRLSNGDFGNFGKLVANLPENQELATLGKLSVNAWRALRDDGGSIMSDLADGWESTFTGANPIALQRELKTANGIDIWSDELTLKLHRVFVSGYSKVAYAATDDPPTDQTVLVVASGKEFKERFDTLGVECNLRGLPYDGHANVQATVDHLKQWTLATTSPSRILASK